MLPLCLYNKNLRHVQGLEFFVLYITCCLFKDTLQHAPDPYLWKACTASSGSSMSPQTHPVVFLTFSHLVHYVSTTSTWWGSKLNWGQIMFIELHMPYNVYITSFELAAQIPKNPINSISSINLVLSLSFSNCSWNQVECLSCCLSFCKMMVFAYILTHSLIRSIPLYFTPPV